MRTLWKTLNHEAAVTTSDPQTDIEAIGHYLTNEKFIFIFFCPDLMLDSPSILNT